MQRTRRGLDGASPLICVLCVPFRGMKPGADVTLAREPRGEAYRMLIDALVGVSQEGLLVVRDQLELTAEGRGILGSLDPFRVRQVRGASWPGTELAGHLATLTYFRACAEAASGA